MMLVFERRSGRAAVSPISTLTDVVLAAFQKCRYKAYLKLRGLAGEPSDYELLQARLETEYRLAAQQKMLRARGPGSVVVSPPSLADAVRGRPALILDATAADADTSCRLDALERADDGTYAPVIFNPHRQVGAAHKQRLVAAAVAGRSHVATPDRGWIVHGPDFKRSRVTYRRWTSLSVSEWGTRG